MARRIMAIFDCSVLRRVSAAASIHKVLDQPLRAHKRAGLQREPYHEL